MIGVFIDTFVILNLTALVIITTQSIPTGLTGTALSQYAFSSVFGKFGNVFIAICMFFFRIFDDYRMVFLWAGQCEIFIWKKVQ